MNGPSRFCDRTRLHTQTHTHMGCVVSTFPVLPFLFPVSPFANPLGIFFSTFRFFLSAAKGVRCWDQVTTTHHGTTTRRDATRVRRLNQETHIRIVTLLTSGRRATASLPKYFLSHGQRHRYLYLYPLHFFFRRANDDSDSPRWHQTTGPKGTSQSHYHHHSNPIHQISRSRPTPAPTTTQQTQSQSLPYPPSSPCHQFPRGQDKHQEQEQEQALG